MRFSTAMVTAAAAGLALTAAKAPPMLTGSGGLWDVSRSASGADPVRVCIPDTGSLAQWEHRKTACTRVVISSTQEKAVVHYTCPGPDFGRSQITMITPRTLRVDTQGISDGYPFGYVLHARRVSDCPGH